MAYRSIAALTVVLGLASACIGPTEGGSGGNGGAGVGGSGGSATCAADETRSCYSGPEGTDGVGICVAGVETCRSDGTWGPCEDEVLPDVEDCTAVGDEDCNAIACSEMVFGMSGDEVEWVQDVVVDSAGNAIMTIELNTTLTLAGVTFTASGADLIVIKLDPNGDPVWMKQFGGAGNQMGGQLALDPDDNIILAGTFHTQINLGGADLTSVEVDAFLAKLTPDGDEMWSYYLGGRSPVGTMGSKTVADIALAESGDIVITGYNNGHWGGCNPCSSSGTNDAFVRVYDADGMLKHEVEEELPGHQIPIGLTLYLDGTIFVVGRFTEGFDLGGAATLPGNTGSHPFVARLDAEAVGEWAVDLNPTGLDSSTARRVVLQSDGTLIVGGAFDSHVIGLDGVDDNFIMAMDPTDGTPIWQKALAAGDGGYPDLAALTLDDDDNIIVGGAFYETLSFDDQSFSGDAGTTDAFLLKLDPAGEHIWSKAFYTDLEYAVVAQVDAGSDGRIVVAGVFDGTVDYGTGPVTSMAGPGAHTFYAASFQP